MSDLSPATTAALSGRAALVLAGAVAGAAALGLEVLAARAMAASVGSGSACWAVLLAVALGSLAAGNLLGGWMAGRMPARRLLTGVLLAAAAAALCLSWLYPPAMRWATSMSVIGGMLVAALATQLTPMLLLGVVAPVVLSAGRRGAGGAWAGVVLAAGSAGGITGALATGLYALPELGIARSYVAIAAVLAVGAIPVAILPGRRIATASVLIVLGACGVGWACRGEAGLIQSRYGQIEIHRDDFATTLWVDGLPQTAIRGSVTVGAGLRNGYLLEAALLLAKTPPRDALVIGLGAGLAPALLEAHGLQCLSVEIDPVVVEVARREFGFRGDVECADGRAFLARQARTWDMIVVDVCTSEKLAWHLFTVEGLMLARERLSRGGVLAIQFISDAGPWEASVLQTVREAFPRCVLLAPAIELAPFGPRWIFAGGIRSPAVPDADGGDSSPMPWRSAEPSASWRLIEPTCEGKLLTDDRFAAERDWSATAMRWRCLYGRPR